MADNSATYEFILIVESGKAQAKLLAFKKVIDEVLKPPSLPTGAATAKAVSGAAPEAAKRGERLVRELDDIAIALSHVSETSAPLVGYWTDVANAMSLIIGKSTEVVSVIQSITEQSAKYVESLGMTMEDVFGARFVNLVRKSADEVVGHSIIPDMVTQIKANLKKFGMTTMGDLGIPARPITEEETYRFGFDTALVAEYNAKIKELQQSVEKLRLIRIATGKEEIFDLDEIEKAKRALRITAADVGGEVLEDRGRQLTDLVEEWNALYETEAGGYRALEMDWRPALDLLRDIRQEYKRLDVAVGGYAEERFQLIATEEFEGAQLERVKQLNAAMKKLNNMLQARAAMGSKRVPGFLQKADAEEEVTSLGKMQLAMEAVAKEHEHLNISLEKEHKLRQEAYDAQRRVKEEYDRQTLALQNYTKAQRDALKVLDETLAKGRLNRGKGLGVSTMDADRIVAAYRQVQKVFKDVTQQQVQLNKVATVVDFGDYYMRQLRSLTAKYYGIRRVGISLDKIGSEITNATKKYVTFFRTAEEGYRAMSREATLAAAAMELPIGMQEIFEDRLLDTAIALKFVTASDLAKGLRLWAAGTGEVIQSFAQLNRMLKETANVQNLALINAATFGDTLTTVGAVLATFNLRIQDTAHIVEVLNFASARSFVTLDELGSTLEQIGPVAADLNISLEEVAAASALLADYGLRGTKSGRALRQVFIQMLRPTEKHNVALNEALGLTTELGESWEQLVFPGGQFIGLAGYIDLLASATENLTDHQRETLLATMATANELPALVALVRAQTQARKQGINVLRVYSKLAENTIDDEVRAYAELHESITGLPFAMETAAETMQKQLGRVTDTAAAEAAELERVWEATMNRIGRSTQEVMLVVLKPVSVAMDRLAQFVEDYPELFFAAATAAAVTTTAGTAMQILGTAIQFLELLMITKGVFTLATGVAKDLATLGAGGTGTAMGLQSITKLLAALPKIAAVAGTVGLVSGAVLGLAETITTLVDAVKSAEKIGRGAAIELDLTKAGEAAAKWKAFGDEFNMTSWSIVKSIQRTANLAGITQLVLEWGDSLGILQGVISSTKLLGKEFKASTEEGRRAMRALGFEEDAVLKGAEEIQEVMNYLTGRAPVQLFDFDEQAAADWGTQWQKTADAVFEKRAGLWRDQIEEDVKAIGNIDIPLDVTVPDIYTLGFEQLEERLKGLAGEVLSYMPEYVAEAGTDAAAAMDELHQVYVEGYEKLTAAADEARQTEGAFTDQYYGERKAAAKEHYEALGALWTAFQEKDADLVADNAKKIEDAEESHLSQLEDLAEDHVERLADLREKAADAEVTAEQAQQKALQDTRDSFTSNEAQIIEDRAREIEKAQRTEAYAELKRVRSYEKDLADAREAAAEAELDAEEKLQENLTDLRASAAKDAQSAREDYLKELLDTQRDFTETEASAYEDHQKALKDAQADEAGIRDDYQNSVVESEKTYRETILDLEEDYQKNLADLQRSHADKLIDLLEARDVKAIRAELKSFQQKKSELHETRDAERQDAEERRNEQLQEAEQRRADTQAELAERLQDMETEYQAEKAERAKEAAAIQAERDAEHVSEQAERAADLAERLAEADQDYTAERAGRQEALAEKLADLQVARDEEAAQRAEDLAVQEAEDAEQREYERLQRFAQHGERLAEMAQEYEDEKVLRTQQLVDDLVDEAEEYAARKADEADKHQDALATLADQLEDARDERRIAYGEEVADLQNMFEEEAIVRENAYQRELLQLKLNNQKHLAEVTAAAAAELKVKLMALEALGELSDAADKERLRKAIDALGQREAEAQAWAERLAAELAEAESRALRKEPYEYGETRPEGEDARRAKEREDYYARMAEEEQRLHVRGGPFEDPDAAYLDFSAIEALARERQRAQAGWNMPVGVGAPARLAGAYETALATIVVKQENWRFEGSMSAADKDWFRTVAYQEAQRAIKETSMRIK